MATPRRVLVDPSVTRFYHCISRCVRRAHLCGHDALSGRNFDHRKQWVVERIHFLARVFAIDVCAYAVMGNHLHLVLRIDGERAACWSEKEVVDRYGRLFPRAVARAGALRGKARAKLVALWRRRLSDLSWYMRALNEHIARRANEEDGCSGRFWEGRFRSQALLDEQAVVACMSYVDLNPLRAGAADSLRGSPLTSIRERLLEAEGEPVEGNLVPFGGERRGGGVPEPLGVAMELEDYVVVLEEMGGAMRSGRGELGEAAAARLRRAGLEPSGLLCLAREWGRRLFTMVGHVHRIEVALARRRQRHCPGSRVAQRLYARAA